MRNKVYFKIRTDGLSGNGTISNPYNGANANMFDAGMRATPSNTDIYWGRGIFLTSGHGNSSPNFVPKDGWRVKGAGIDKTILKLVGTTTGDGGLRKIAISHDYDVYFHNMRWENFTIDCNADGQVEESGLCFGGISVAGQNILLRKIKVINCGSRAITYEAFGITNGGVNLITRQPFTGAVIDSCIVQNPIISNVVDGFTAIVCGGATWPGEPFEWHDRPIMKNCYVNLSGYNKTGYSSTYSQAYSFYGKNAIMYNNTCEYCKIGLYDDTSIVLDITIRNNSFKNVQYGVAYNNYTSPGLLKTGVYLNNYISFADERTYPDAFYGFYFLGKVGISEDISSVFISGNTIENSNGQYKSSVPEQKAYLASFYHVLSGVVKGNNFSVYNTGDTYLNGEIYTARVSGILSGENYSIIRIPLP